MKITLIHGQSHKGSTYHVARILAEKIDGEITEIVLPRDFDQMCVGCAQCIKKDEKLCPHYEKLAPITEAIDAADLLIFESPVYVYHVTSAMKALLEHYGWRWIMHRPEESMFKKADGLYRDRGRWRTKEHLSGYGGQCCLLGCG